STPSDAIDRPVYSRAPSGAAALVGRVAVVSSSSSVQDAGRKERSEAAMRVFLVAVGAASFLLLACGQDVGPAARDSAHALTVRVDGPGRLLSLPPAIDCPGTCAASF